MDASPRQALFSRIDYERTCGERRSGRRFDLVTMRNLVELLDHPERSYPIVHVAGTKGKGSTAHFLAGMLAAAGIRVGLYTSPHLQHLEERYRLNGREIEPGELDDLIVEMSPLIDHLDQLAGRTGRCGPPTFFEWTTAIAFEYFARQRVDLAVIEVGVGGRLDSTNVCRPVVSVINRVGLDHTHLLGTDVAAIAREKGGIIKPGVPVVCGAEDPEAIRQIQQIANKRGAPLTEMGLDFGYVNRPASSLPKTTTDPVFRFDYWSARENRREWLNDLRMIMAGQHQAHNAALALAVCDQLERAGWKIDPAHRREGLRTCRVPARIEFLSVDPPVIVDMAHNLPSLIALVETLNQCFPNGPRAVAFSVCRDKEVDAMLEVLCRNFDHVVLSRFLGNPRAADPHQLAARAQAIVERLATPRLQPDHLMVTEDPMQAWQSLSALEPPEGLRCIAGSTFFAAEIIAICRRQADAVLT